MLDPEYLEKFSDQLLALIDELELAIIADIAKRLVKTGNITDTSRGQAQIAQEAGIVYQDVVKRVSQTSGYIEKEVERLFQEAGVKNLENEAVIYKRAGKQAITLGQSKTMQRLLEANIRKTKGDINNLTLTTAVEAQTVYINVCNKAMMKVQTGAFSYDKAVADAVKEAAVQGAEVLYPSGHVDKLDVAVRRAALTGVNQSAAQLNLQYASEAGCDYVETTAHVLHTQYGRGVCFVFLEKTRSIRHFMRALVMEPERDYAGGIAGIIFMRTFLVFLYRRTLKLCCKSTKRKKSNMAGKSTQNMKSVRCSGRKKGRYGRPNGS